MFKSLIRESLTLCLAVFVTFGSASVSAKELAIVGSSTVLPIAQITAEAYMKEHPGVNISVSGGGSGVGIKSLIDGICDIADSSRFIKFKEVKEAVSRGVYPVPFAIAYDCIVPVVHPSNPVSNLTVDQLRSIYTGRIRNWKQVGGPDKTIVVVSRDTSSGTYEVWEEKVLKGARVYPGALLQASNGAVRSVVSRNKQAIGYIGMGYVNSSVKPLRVEGIKATKENALNGSYVISRPLYMFVKGWPKEEISKFIKFVTHPQKGQILIEKAGFIPLY